MSLRLIYKTQLFPCIDFYPVTFQIQLLITIVCIFIRLPLDTSYQLQILTILVLFLICIPFFFFFGCFSYFILMARTPSIMLNGGMIALVLFLMTRGKFQIFCGDCGICRRIVYLLLGRYSLLDNGKFTSLPFPFWFV